MRPPGTSCQGGLAASLYDPDTPERDLLGTCAGHRGAREDRRGLMISHTDPCTGWTYASQIRARDRPKLNDRQERNGLLTLWLLTGKGDIIFPFSPKQACEGILGKKGKRAKGGRESPSHSGLNRPRWSWHSTGFWAYPGLIELVQNRIAHELPDGAEAMLSSTRIAIRGPASDHNYVCVTCLCHLLPPLSKGKRHAANAENSWPRNGHKGSRNILETNGQGFTPTAASRIHGLT